MPSGLEVRRRRHHAGLLAINHRVWLTDVQTSETRLSTGTLQLISTRLVCSIRYYRTSNASVDLRRCRDFGENSGCIGGVGDGEGPCKPGLAVR